MRIAVLDCGSTSFHLLVADVDVDGALSRHLRRREMLLIGAAIGTHGVIAPPLIEAAARSVRNAREVAEDAGADRLIAVGTSALRDAANGAEVVGRIGDALGTALVLLDGDEESIIARHGMLSSVATGDGPVLTADLGGGSLELALGDRCGAVRAITLPLGAVRLAGSIGVAGAFNEVKRRALGRHITQALHVTSEWTPAPCVAAGGAVRALAKVLAIQRWPDPPQSLNQFTLRRRELRAAWNMLAPMTRARRLALPAMKPSRVAAVPYAAAVLSSINTESVTISNWGLREGLALDAAGHKAIPTADQLREKSVAHLVRQWGTSEIAVPAGDETLGYAARLSQIGQTPRQAAELVDSAHMRGFSPQERDMLTCLVRFHRTGVPKERFPAWQRLDPAQARRTARLCVALAKWANSRAEFAG